MKSFFKISNINDYSLLLKYNKITLNEFIISNKTKIFEPYELFCIINRYKDDILIDKLTIEKFLKQIKLNEDLTISMIDIYDSNNINDSNFNFDDFIDFITFYLHFRYNQKTFYIAIRKMCLN